MLSLPESQQAFAATIMGGPALCPASLFAGTHDRTLLGLKFQANTISHARLIALEETFPHTREAMGEMDFNAASRAFLDAGQGRSQSLARIGEDFPDWLESSFATLARFEWNWLEAYHAAEAEALGPEALADASTLLGGVISPHPAARLIASDGRVTAVVGLTTDTRYILIVRPDADVLVHPLIDPVASLFARFDGIACLGEIVETFWAEWPNEDAAAGLNTLLSIGALTMEIASC